MLDADGFLPSMIGRQSGQLLRPLEAAELGAFVLLGEPGAGKTTTFAALAGIDVEDGLPLPPVPGKSGIVWVTGSELTELGFRECLGDHFEVLPIAGQQVQPPEELVVVLDQLDESTVLRRLPRLIEKALAGKDTRGLRLLVACRTADYPEPLTAVLKKAKGECVLGDLAPLSREDAATLASALGVDAEAFLTAVIANGLGVLAAVPLTLQVLLSAYEDDPSSLSGEPGGLFDRGVRVLADEHDPKREPPTTTVEERIAVASRIAAHLMLSGHRTLWSGPQIDTVSEEIMLSDLCHGTESAGLGTFTVTPATVRETLATALFARTGPDRVGFAHSSFAAFLAARYLAARLDAAIPQDVQQLSGLFLVSAPDEDTSIIPSHLRETAAWLLAHAPRESGWLAAADPEALVAHTTIITEHETRAVIVDGLLRRAAQVELTDRPWQRVPWRLAHPGLEDRLRTELESAADNPSIEWSDLARARLAVRMARDCGLATLAEPLLRIAESPGWPVSLRRSAATAAMQTSPIVAAPRLQHLLADLGSPVAEPQAPDDLTPDSENEFVGALLSLLWPDHLPIAAALPHIRAIDHGSYLGTYYYQVLRFAQGVPDEDIGALTAYASDTLQARHAANQSAQAGGSDSQATGGGRLWASSSDRSLRDLITSIVERVLRSSQAQEHLPTLAKPLAWLLAVSDRIPMPTGIDIVEADGRETDAARALRYALVEALVECYLGEPTPFGHPQAFLITSHWTRCEFPEFRELPGGLHSGGRARLLDNRDLLWVFDQVDSHRGAGNTAAADAFGHISAMVADLSDPPTHQLVYDRRETPEWRLFRWAYDAVPLDGEVAAEWRRRTTRTRPWPDEGAFVALQNQRLVAAEEGDAEAFRDLAWNLRFNPVTGYSEPTSPWGLSSFPGTALWEREAFYPRFRAAARRYLAVEHDHREAWLGTRTVNKIADAGLVALTALRDCDGAEGLDDLASPQWAAWTGAILDLVYRDNGQNDGLARDLISRVGRHATEELAAALAQFVRTWLGRGERLWTLDYLTDTLPPAVNPTATSLAEEIRSALLRPEGSDVAEGTAPPTAPIRVFLPDTDEAREAAVLAWATLLHRPLIAADPGAIAQVRQALTKRDNSTMSRLAQFAGLALLVVETADMWPVVHHEVTRDRPFSHALAEVCAGSDHTNAIAESLPEEALADAYLWLADVAAPDAELYRPASSVSADEYNIHNWRNAILATLSGRGTNEAVRNIRRLDAAYPQVLSIQAALIDARRKAQSDGATTLTPPQIHRLLADPERRVVHTATQLAQVVNETIRRIVSDLPTHGNLLWDSERTLRTNDTPKGKKLPPKWRPKPEGTLAAYIAHELKLRLERHPVVINREVVVKPTDAGDSGLRPDILVTALTPGEANEVKKLVVPIEIKGAWHEDVLTAQRTQLADDYISAEKTDAGVYIVAWYPLNQWDAPNDRRKTEAKSHETSDNLLTRLRAQASDILADTAKHTFPHVITIERATNDGTTR